MMIVVALGKPVEDGEELRERVEKASRIFNEESAEYLVVSGGKVDPDSPKPEAAFMREYVESVPSEKVILEDKSKGTIGNAYFTRRKLESLDADTERVCIVTSCYHSERARFIFKRIFGSKANVESRCLKFNNPEAEKDEEDSFEAARGFFQDVPIGEMERIREKLIETFDNVELD